MGWDEGTVHLDASGLYPGVRIYALFEGSATLKYAQIVAWLDLQRLVPRFPNQPSTVFDDASHELPALET